MIHAKITVQRTLILRGWEGQAAAHYIAAFSGMLKTDELSDFDFATRKTQEERTPIRSSP